ncbi:MAG: exodeoxyribonuclease V subunit gamma [Oscillospiraceae bacterium]|nr:exodeoxyribonuclease V subunit gamma [Oscillospiraceae bacterium]
MLNFIAGPPGSGKTTEIKSRIRKTRKKNTIIIVPEQTSFDAEVSFIDDLGAQSLSYARVLSFTSLARLIFSKYGGIAGEYADDTAKLILMSRAVRSVADKLEFYAKNKHKSDFPSYCLQAVNEIKNSGFCPVEFEKKIHRLPPSALKTKAIELSVIYSAYDALLYQAYNDPLDDLSRVAAILSENRNTAGAGFFSDFSIYIDGFTSFTAPQLKIISFMLCEAEDFTAALTLENGDNIQGGTLFSECEQTYRALKNLAHTNSVPVSPPVSLSPGKRFANPALAHLERNIMRPVYPPFAGGTTADAVTLKFAGNEYDEVDSVMCKIPDLVRNGYRFRDIALIASDFSVYGSVIEAGLRKYDIPGFISFADDLSVRPLMRFVSCLLSAAGNINSVLAMLKCDVTDISLENICVFENYVYTWSIHPRWLSEEFTAHPRGFQDEWSDEDYKNLQTANLVREKIHSILSGLAVSGNSKDAAVISRGIYDIILQTGIEETLNKHLDDCIKHSDFNEAKQIERDWNTLMELLSVLATSLQGHTINIEEYLELYILAVKSKKQESVPKTGDCITIGDADSIRTSNFKVVFILGANEGFFPRFPDEYGAFSDDDRKVLRTLDMKLAPLIEEQIINEKFLVYTRLSSARERLYVSYRRTDIAGAPLRPSAFIAQIQKMFSITEQEAERAPEYFEKNLLAKNGSLRTEYKLSGKRAEIIFGKRMNVSPSSIEKYHTCPFAYFCDKGLSLFPRRRAEMDPIQSGSLMHHVLYCVITENPEFIYMKADELKTVIKKTLQRYLEQTLGGFAFKTQRFLYLFGMTVRPLSSVAQKLQKEIAASGFRPAEFEMELKQPENSEPFASTDGGIEVRISGRLDRLDMMYAGGKKYLRVTDYKKKKKSFRISDLYYGINLQMLIYLYYLCRYHYKNTEKYYPAGIMYQPLNEAPMEKGRQADPEKLEKARAKHYCADGMVIADPAVIEAFNAEARALNTKPPYREDTLWSEDESDKVFGFIQQKAARMAKDLFEGRIAASPLKAEYHPCKSCGYKEICGRNENIPADRNVGRMSKQEFLARIIN